MRSYIIYISEYGLFLLTPCNLYLSTLSHDRSPIIFLVKQFSIQYFFFLSINESPAASILKYEFERICMFLLGLSLQK